MMARFFKEGPMRLTEVRSLVDLSEAKLDAENFTVEGARIIRAGLSLNGNYYSESVIEAAIPLFEGVKAYADHPSKTERKDRPERSVRDLVGYYQNARYQEGAAYADFKVVGEAQQWLWPWIQEAVETKKPHVGLSINALGRGSKGKYEGKPANIVEAITHANSVDVVTEASAGGGFDHLLQSDDGWTRAVLENTSLEELTEANPDLVEAFKRQWATARDSQAIREAQDQAAQLEQRAADLTEENQTLKAQLVEARKDKDALQKAALVDRLLEGAKNLPNKWKQAVRTQLLKSEPEEWEAILEREAQKFQAVKGKVPVTGAGRIAPSAPTVTTINPVETIHEALGAKRKEGEPPPDAPSEVLIEYYRGKNK